MSVHKIAASKAKQEAGEDNLVRHARTTSTPQHSHPNQVTWPVSWYTTAYPLRDLQCTQHMNADNPAASERQRALRCGTPVQLLSDLIDK